jgi:hypothetical protein
MVDEKDKRKQQADELEERLKEQEKKLTDAEEDALSADEVDLAEVSPGEELGADQRFEIGYRAVARAEKDKEANALSRDIADKYQAVGRGMLDDPSSRPLDASIRHKVSEFLGHDPGAVRVHTGEMAEKAADALGAKAFALGASDIYFGRGEFAPDTTAGLGTLVHELTHAADNAVGAAFSGESSDADRGAAETRARGAEAQVHQQAQGSAGAEAAADEPIDMRKLEDKVADILEKGQRRSADRTGGSGG